MTGLNRMRRHHPDRTPSELPYPVDQLPRPIREAVQCIWERHQVHPAISASIAHAALSIAMQARLMVRLPDGRLRPASMFFLVLNSSGNGKSIPYDAFMLPQQEHDAIIDAAYEAAKRQYPSQHADWKKLRANLVKAIGNAQTKGEPHDHLVAHLERLKEPAEPRPRNTLISDTTGAGFIDRIAGNNQSVAIATDEAAVAFTHMYQYFGHANLAWGGSSLTVHRKGGGTKVIRNPRIGALIVSQPDIFYEFCARHGDIAAASGAWARYLIAFPPDVKDKVYPANPASISWEPVVKLQALIWDWISEQDRREEAEITNPCIIAMDDDAAECFTTFANEMNERMRPGNNLDDVKDFASKAAEHAARLAAEYASLNKEAMVTTDTMARAIAIIRYHLEAYVNQFSLVRAVPTVVKNAQKLETYFRRQFLKKGWIKVELDHLHHNGSSDELRLDEHLLPALMYLREQGKIQLEPSPGGGKLRVNFLYLTQFQD